MEAAVLPRSPAASWPRLKNVEPGDRVLPLLMGVVNSTPDSFYDGGCFLDVASAGAQIDRLVTEGADLIDVGAESTRPGHVPVSAAQQIQRLEGVLPHALQRARWVSVDTAEPEVAEYAASAGAQVINDVSCLANIDLARVVARAGAVLVLTHSRGPVSQQRGGFQDQDYTDVVGQVWTEWARARDRAVGLGVDAEKIWFDPGIGFAKNAAQSYEILRRLREYRSHQVPLVLGVSRKSFISAASDTPAAERLPGTVAACVHAFQAGVAVLRVHDVGAVRQALQVIAAIQHFDKQD